VTLAQIGLYVLPWEKSCALHHLAACEDLTDLALVLSTDVLDGIPPIQSTTRLTSPSRLKTLYVGNSRLLDRSVLAVFSVLVRHFPNIKSIVTSQFGTVPLSVCAQNWNRVESRLKESQQLNKPVTTS